MPIMVSELCPFLLQLKVAHPGLMDTFSMYFFFCSSPVVSMVSVDRMFTNMWQRLSN